MKKFVWTLAIIGTLVLLYANVMIGLALFFPKLHDKIMCQFIERNGHWWTHEASDTWLWVYKPEGGNYIGGYKYRVKPNKIYCARCGTVLFDKTIVEDDIYPIES